MIQIVRVKKDVYQIMSDKGNHLMSEEKFRKFKAAIAKLGSGKFIFRKNDIWYVTNLVT